MSDSTGISEAERARELEKQKMDEWERSRIATLSQAKQEETCESSDGEMLDIAEEDLPKDPRRRESYRRAKEKEAMEAWEAKVGGAKGSPPKEKGELIKELSRKALFGEAQEPAATQPKPKPAPTQAKPKQLSSRAPTAPASQDSGATDAALEAERRREEEARQAEEWERKRVGKSIKTTSGKPAQEPKPAAITETQPQKVEEPKQPEPKPNPPSPQQQPTEAMTAEQKREEEARQAAEWERKRVGKSMKLPSSLKQPAAGSEPEPKPEPKLEPKQDASSIATPKETTTTTMASNAPPVDEALDAERRREAEAEQALAWERKRVGTIAQRHKKDEPDRASILGEVTFREGSSSETPQPVEVAATTAGQVTVVTDDPVMDAEQRRQEEIRKAEEWERARRVQTEKETTNDAGEDDDPDVVADGLSLEEMERRRIAEQERMAAWENKVGGKGKVQDLFLGEETKPLPGSTKMSLKPPDAPSSNISRGRSASFGFEKKTATGTATPQKGNFHRTASDATMLKKKEKRDKVDHASSPIQKAMYEFTETEDLVEILTTFDRLKSLAMIDATSGLEFFEELKVKIAAELDFKRGHLLRVVDKRLRKSRAMMDSGKIKSCKDVKAVIVGAGPVGLRAALELAMLEADVTVIEMRTSISRHNILHLWDWVCTDLLELGCSNSDLLGKSFYHISTRRLQLVLLRLAMVMGVKVYCGVKFIATNPPATPKETWGVKVTKEKDGYHDACPKIINANLLVEAGGAQGPVLNAVGFQRKKSKISQNLGLVAHFKISPSDRGLDEFSVSSQFKQSAFKALRDKGLCLENCVYYQGDTHYFVMTPTLGSLKNYGAIKQAGNAAEAVKSGNVDDKVLRQYARDVAEFFDLPSGTPFIDDRAACGLFDFSARTMCKQPSKLLDTKASPNQLLVYVVGDALIEPFWPEGLGCNRGFLSVLDMSYIVQEYYHTGVMAKENMKKYAKVGDKLFEIMKSLSAHTKKKTLRDEVDKFTLDPNSRYLKWKTG